MLRIILILTVLGLTTGLFASNPKANNNDLPYSQIKGKVKSINKQKALPLAHVVVYSEDSDVIKVATTDKKGNFNINNLPAGEYFLNISYLGYKSQIVSGILVSSSHMIANLKNLLLECTSYEIDEVVIKADKIKNNYLTAVQ